MKDCVYPECSKCTYDDCVMEYKDICAILKRRRYKANPEKYRQKQRDYRKRVSSRLPYCDECDECILVRKDKGEGFRKLCLLDIRLIEQKVSNSPHWCKKRVANARNRDGD